MGANFPSLIPKPSVARKKSLWAKRIPSCFCFF